MKILITFMILSNIANTNVQSKNFQSFSDKFNHLLLEVKKSLINSREFVGDIYSLKSDEKSRVLILDYVDAYDQLLSLCHAASELISIYVAVPKREVNNDLFKTLEQKIANNFIDIRNNLEELIDSFDFYIESEFSNYKKIEILKSKMLFTIKDILLITYQS